MSRRLKDYNDDYVSGRVGNMTPAGLFFRVVGVILLLAIFLSIIGFAAGWFKEGQRIVSPQNVRTQYTALYQGIESLQATASNACALRSALDNAASDDVRTQRESQLLATEQNYRRIAADYNRRFNNTFEAGIVHPSDLPEQAPTLEQMQREVCP